MSRDKAKRTQRFDDTSTSQEQKLSADAVSDKNSHQLLVGVFKLFYREKQLPVDLSTCSAEELNDTLQKFYGGLTDEKRRDLPVEQISVS